MIIERPVWADNPFPAALTTTAYARAPRRRSSRPPPDGPRRRRPHRGRSIMDGEPMTIAELTITVGVASRRGTRDHNADAGHAYRADDGTVTAAVIDSTCSTRRRSRRSARRSRTA